ncbi:MAG: hypothetical protein PUD80_00615, partial [Firmicutes bacterium]|nr:hypothetical protein [Bacillota bacterium]
MNGQVVLANAAIWEYDKGRSSLSCPLRKRGGQGIMLFLDKMVHTILSCADRAGRQRRREM